MARLANLRTSLSSPSHRAAGVALAIRLGNAVLAYAAQVVLARLMGQYEYGIFAYTWVWFVVFGAFATLGFGDATLRFVPQLRERGEEAALRGYVRFAPLAIVATSILAAALLTVAMLFAGPLVGGVYVLPMMLMALSLPFACLQAFLEGVGRCFGWTVAALLPIYVLRHGLLLVSMIAAIALGFAPTAVTALVCLLFAVALSFGGQALAILPRLGSAIPRGPREFRAREWLRGALPFSALHGAANLLSFADVVVLSFFVGPTEIAVYFAATRAIQVVNLVPYAATVGAAHLLSAAHARGDAVELQRLCRQMSLMTFVVAVAGVAGVLLAGDFLLAMFGRGFEAGALPLAILAAGVVVRVLAGPAEDVLNMTGHGRLSASTFLAVIALNIALAVALVGPFGIAGAATASALAMAARAGWLALAVRRRLGIDTSIPAILLAGSARRPRPSMERAEGPTPAE